MKRFGTAGRRASTALLTVLVATAGLIALPGTVAAAAHAVPWRFTTVTQSTSISGYGGAAYIKTFTLQCPAGYIPVSGGVVGPTSAEVEHLARIEEWPDSTDGTYTLVLINEGFNGTALNLAVNCVWLADVGTITYVYGHFSRNSTNGRAGGSASCLNNQLLLSAAVAWTDYTPNRTINFSTPITGGTSHAYGWFASGYSDVSGSMLNVEMRCVDASLLSASYVEAEDSAVGYGYYAPKSTCTTGYRILTGGAGPTDLLHPTSDQGWATSGPFDTKQYTAFGNAETGVVIRAMSVCVPSSTVSVGFTDTPPALSTLNTDSITFSATDSAGEAVTLACYLDGIAKGCASGNPVAFGPLVDGAHQFDVYVHNQYGSTAHAGYNWTIDTTAPWIVSHSPTSDAPLGGPFTITFDAAVTGVDTSSVTVHDETANVNVSGTVGRPLSYTATWTPSANLTAGHTYRFSFSSAIKDGAGNALIPTFFTVATVAPTVYPTITGHSPTSNASLTGPFTITFSEPVDGVTSSSLTVHAVSANADVAGTISRPTTSTATWTPAASLVPGETYRFSFTSAIHDGDNDALAPTSFTVRATTIVENTSAVLKETWDRDSSSLASGGYYVSSNLSGTRAELTFTATSGQTVSVYGMRLSSGGYADIYLDNVKVATASFYASSTGRARVYLSGGLTAGSHTISIRPLGTKPSASTGTWVGIDSVAYGSTVKQESSMSQRFRRTTTSSAYSSSYDVISHKTDGDTTLPRYQVTVVGTGVKLYATKTTTSGSAKVYVDGVLKATISLHASATTYKALVYSGSFALGVHVVRIDVVGTSSGSSSYVDLDRITVL